LPRHSIARVRIFVIFIQSAFLIADMLMEGWADGLNYPSS